MDQDNRRSARGARTCVFELFKARNERRDPSHERLGQSPAGLQLLRLLLRLLPPRGANACDRGTHVGGGGAREFDGTQSGAQINVGARVRVETTGCGRG